jgi:hypothetical protein
LRLGTSYQKLPDQKEDCQTCGDQCQKPERCKK